MGGGRQSGDCSGSLSCFRSRSPWRSPYVRDFSAQPCLWGFPCAGSRVFFFGGRVKSLGDGIADRRLIVRESMQITALRPGSCSAPSRKEVVGWLLSSRLPTPSFYPRAGSQAKKSVVSTTGGDGGISTPSGSDGARGLHLPQ